MKVLMDKPINVDEVEFKPRVVGQTTLYPLDEQMRDTLLDLRRRYETDFNSVYEKGNTFSIPGPWTLLAQVSFDEDVNEGRIRLSNWSPKNKVAGISRDAREVYEALQTNLGSYTEGMEPKGKYPNPELNWRYKIGNTLYELQVEFSDDRRWLIASPEITLDIVSGKTEYDNSGKPLSHHVQGPFEDKDGKYDDFERVFHALLTGSEVAKERPRFLRMDFGILKFGVRPIPASELKGKLESVDALLHRVLENKDLVYEAVDAVRGKVVVTHADPNLQRAGEFIRQIPKSSSGLENYMSV